MVGCCQTVACAPQNEVNTELDEITGTMWSSLTIRCVLGGLGGAWKGEGGGLYIQIEQPQNKKDCMELE